jgi:TonB family protein
MQQLRVWLSGWILLCVLCPLVGAQPEQKAKEAESLHKKYNAALQEIARLQQELESVRRDLDTLKKYRLENADDAPAADFFLAGNAYVNLQKYPEAVAAFTRAMERAPHDAPSVRNRGIAYTHLGAYQQALNDLNKALELDPQDAVAYNHRGIASYALGNPQQAIASFDKALELQPKLAEAYNNRGIVLHMLGNYRQASKDFDSAVQLGMALAAQHLQVLRDEILKAQERLRQAGINPGPADGIPGQQTMAALQQFQRTQSLPVTGLLDNATKHALGLQPSALAASPQAAAVSAPRFVHQPKPEYPLLARQQGWEGSVTLRLEMLADGTVGEVQIVQSSGHSILDTAAQATAKTWTHVPATQDGEAGTRWSDVTLTFTLDKASAAKDAKQ